MPIKTDFPSGFRKNKIRSRAVCNNPLYMQRRTPAKEQGKLCYAKQPQSQESWGSVPHPRQSRTRWQQGHRGTLHSGQGVSTPRKSQQPFPRVHLTTEGQAAQGATERSARGRRRLRGVAGGVHTVRNRHTQQGGNSDRTQLTQTALSINWT